MSTPIISQTLTITCQGPVHVGSGDILDPMQYIYDSQNRRAYFISESAWTEYLASRRLLQPFIKFIQNFAHNKSLFAWCQANGVRPDTLKKISIGWAHVPVQPDRDTRYLNNVHLLARSADGRPYIPGSSIKGALRTAILHRLVSKLSPGQRQRYWLEFLQAVVRPPVKELKKNADDLIRQLEMDLLHRIDRRDEYDQPVRPDNAVNSVLQGLRVEDAYPAAPTETYLVRKVDWQIVRPQKNPEKYLPLTRECFVPGTRLTCSLTVEPAFLSIIGFTSVRDILQAAGEFTQSVLTLEKAAFGSRLKPLFPQYADSNLILGGGTGLLDKTLLYSLAPREEVKASVAAMLDILFSRTDKRIPKSVPIHRHAALDKTISPRTLKIGKLQGKTCLMGLCRLETMPC